MHRPADAPASNAGSVPMSPLRAGVVGLGTMGRHHVRVLSDLPGVELVGATDPEPRARTRPVGPVTDDLGELLALGIDICVVATPTLTHTDIGLQLAEAGVHTLIEKPLASDPESGRLLAKAFDERAWSAAWAYREIQPSDQRPASEACARRARIGVPDYHTPPRALPAADSGTSAWLWILPRTISTLPSG